MGHLWFSLGDLSRHMFAESSPGQRVAYPTMNPRRFAHSSCFFVMQNPVCWPDRCRCCCCCRQKATLLQVDSSFLLVKTR
jgi:hypothetical protein